MTDIKPPEPGSRWKHASGNFYHVLAIANESATKTEDYPVTVVYRDYKNRTWSRPLSKWHQSMSPAPIEQSFNDWLKNQGYSETFSGMSSSQQMLVKRLWLQKSNGE